MKSTTTSSSTTSQANSPKSIEIPTRDGSEVVEVFLDELPEEAEELCDILVSEEAPIELFKQFALEYYKRGHKHAFNVLVKRGLKESKTRKSTSSSTTASKLNSLLAAHYIAEGMALGPADKKNASVFLSEATDCLNEAEKRISGSGNIDEISLRKGLLMLAKNMIEPAGLIFKFILDKSPGNFPALLGQACFNFLIGNFRSALQGFQSILRNHPELNEIRAAIGYCFQRLGFKEMAQKAFQRVLAVDPQNEAALLALGFLQLESSKSPQNLQSGLIQIKGVFELNRSNAVAQIHLANHFFFKKEFTKAKSLSDGAILNAPNDKIRAEAYFILAKISHINGNFSDAFTNYQCATKLSPEFLPALFGLGQCFLARGDLEGAVLLFEKILESDPNCPEVLRLLALINSSKLAKRTTTEESPESSAVEVELTKKTLNYLNRALKVFPADLLLLKCAAVLHESSDPEKAVKYYAASAAEDSDNFAILNNFVVLKQSLKMANDSTDRNLLKRAQSMTNDPLMKTFVKFNEARLLEDFDGQFSKAEEVYKEILMENPNFPLAHLRLGAICFGRNQYAEAADHFKDVAGADDQNRDAWNCVAATHLKQKAFNNARKSFERVLVNIDKNDPYALVSLGNISLELARHDKANKHTDDHHRRAGEFYGKALSLDRGNLYAAQGLGIIFADRGLPAEAREIFTQVRACAVTLTEMDSTLNLAHSLTELGKYPAAVTLYVHVIESSAYAAISGAKKVSLLLFLCRARYLLALDSADFGAADLALQDIHKALDLLPNDAPLKFNLGLLLQARAQAIRNSKDDSVTPELLNSAIESVKEAEAIFSSGKFDKFDEKLIASRLSMCPGLIQGIQARAELNEKSVKDQTDRLEQLKIQREVAAMKESEERALKAEKDLLRLAEIEANRRELVQKMKETDEKVKAASHQRLATKKSTNDSDNSGSESENENEPKQRKKRIKTASSSVLETEAEDNDLDGITGGNRRRRRGKRSSATSSGPLLSKEFISSDEDEDEKMIRKDSAESEDEKAIEY